MVNEGSSSSSNTPSVDLMMPAPMRTTSGSVLNVSGIGFLLQVYGVAAFRWRASRSGRNPLQLASAKRHRGPWLEHHVGAAPGRIVGQLPAAPGPDRVFSKQDVAGVEKE